MDNKKLETKIDAFKNSVDLLILIEFSKHGVRREDAREILGSLENNTFSKLNKIFNNKT